MSGTVVVDGSPLRRVVYLGATLLAAVFVLAGVWSITPTEDEVFTRSAVRMESVARLMAEGDELGEQTVGTLTFERVYRKNGLVFFEKNGGLLDDRPYGYIWSPHAHLLDLEHVKGPWYAYSDHVEI
ncbi:hypothetical protein [Nonomuraea longicatena]|uniref:Uncharacterized protein n=1 Tax=Nonomuraea longicatena TaxID=83682 RepID=A0ABN1R814_9ACTN